MTSINWFACNCAVSSWTLGIGIAGVDVLWLYSVLFVQLLLPLIFCRSHLWVLVVVLLAVVSVCVVVVFAC